LTQQFPEKLSFNSSFTDIFEKKNISLCLEYLLEGQFQPEKRLWRTLERQFQPEKWFEQMRERRNRMQ
jgi:hypothetical protein